MTVIERIESFIIRRVDVAGIYRYHIGKRKIGVLETYRGLPNIFYLMAPAYGNIGDEAIVEASILFLNDMYPNKNVVVIDYLDTLQTLKEIRRILKTGDLIFLQGGGNIGTLYYDAECMREFIVKKFRDVPIISMPQSMYFANTSNGNKKMNKCRTVFNSHPNLTLIAREKYTYCDMKKAFPNCKVILNPDIVFYYSKKIDNSNSYCRTGIMTCLRTDEEDVLGELRFSLINTIASTYGNVIVSDTCVARNIPYQMRSVEVLSLINQFRRVKIVLTDRLHGMVLAALTNTPCVVMPSLDKKVLGTYEWIADAKFIRFIDKVELDNIVQILDDMMSKSYEPYDWTSFRDKFFISLRTRLENNNE